MLADETYERKRCAACGVEMVMVWMPSGKRNPVDPDPTINGNIRLTGAGAGTVLGKRAVEDDTSGALYISHFATCTRPKAFKR